MACVRGGGFGPALCKARRERAAPPPQLSRLLPHKAAPMAIKEVTQYSAQVRATKATSHPVRWPPRSEDFCSWANVCRQCATSSNRRHQAAEHLQEGSAGTDAALSVVEF